MQVTQIGLDVNSGGASTEVVLSTSSAQGPLVTLPTNHPPGVPVKCLVVVDVTCWIRKGANPTAVTGTDQKLLAGSHRVELLVGERIAAVAGGAGTLNFTQNS